MSLIWTTKFNNKTEEKVANFFRGNFNYVKKHEFVVFFVEVLCGSPAAFGVSRPFPILVVVTFGPLERQSFTIPGQSVLLLCGVLRLNAYVKQDWVLLFCLAWAIHSRHDPAPPLLALMVNLLSVFLDIIVLAVSFPRRDSTEEYSAVMAIFNLILRLASSLVLYKSLEHRDDFDGNPPEEPEVTQANHHHPSVDSGRVSRTSSRASNNNGHYGIYPGGGPPIEHNPYKQQQELPSIPPSYSQHRWCIHRFAVTQICDTNINTLST